MGFWKVILGFWFFHLFCLGFCALWLSCIQEKRRGVRLRLVWWVLVSFAQPDLNYVIAKTKWQGGIRGEKKRERERAGIWLWLVFQVVDTKHHGVELRHCFPSTVNSINQVDYVIDHCIYLCDLSSMHISFSFCVLMGTYLID